MQVRVAVISALPRIPREHFSFLETIRDRDPAFNANIRFNLIHHPLSDRFIVDDDQRILTPDSPVAGRGIIVKFTQMMSF